MDIDEDERWIREWTLKRKALTAAVNDDPDDDDDDDEDVPAVDDDDMMLFDEDDEVDSSRQAHNTDIESVWFNNIIVGVALTSVRRFFHANSMWIHFRHHIVHRLNLTHLDVPPSFSVTDDDDDEATISVMILDKSRSLLSGHTGAVAVRAMCDVNKLANFLNSSYLMLPTAHTCAAARSSSSSIPLPSSSSSSSYRRRRLSVTIVDPSRQSLEKQISSFVSSDILITPCGGISLLSGFLRRGGIGVFTDYYNPQLGSVHMEDTMWKYMSFRDLYYPIAARELAPSYSPFTQLYHSMAETQFDAFRNLFNFKLDFNLLRYQLQREISSHECRPRHLHHDDDNDDDDEMLRARRVNGGLMFNDEYEEKLKERDGPSPTDWLHCNASDGSVAHAGVCEPPVSFTQQLSNFFALINMAFADKCA